MSLANNKPLLLGIAGGLAAILVAGYFYAAGKGVEEFEDFLYDNDLRDAIRYRDVSYSPLSDTITLEDVDLEVVVMELGDQQQKMTGKLDSLVIENASKESRQSIHFSGYHLVTDPSPSERKENIVYQLLDDPLKFVQQMGVDETSLSGTVAYDYDRDEETLSMVIALDAGNIARVSLELSLAEARKLVDTEVSDFILASVMQPKQQQEEFGKVELVSLSADLEDHGFVERLMYMGAVSDFDYANVLNNDLPFDALEAARASEADRDNMAKYFDEDGVEILSNFRARGGDLQISVSTERPVRLADLVKDDRLHRDIRVEVDN